MTRCTRPDCHGFMLVDEDGQEFCALCNRSPAAAEVELVREVIVWDREKRGPKPHPMLGKYRLPGEAR